MSEGGLLVALAEMVINGKKGAKIRSDLHPFEEYPARFIVEVSMERLRDFKEFFEKKGVDISFLGSVEGDDLNYNDERISFKEMKDAYEDIANSGECQ